MASLKWQIDVVYTLISPDLHPILRASSPVQRIAKQASVLPVNLSIEIRLSRIPNIRGLLLPATRNIEAVTRSGAGLGSWLLY